MLQKKEVFPGILMKSEIAAIESGNIEYEISGSGDRCVLVSHGLLGGIDQARVISDWIDRNEFRVLCLSRPGYLRTPIETGIMINQQADAYAELLEKLKISKTGVIAFAGGAPSAYSFVMRYPEKCSALVVISGISGYYQMPFKSGPVARAIYLSAIGKDLMKYLSSEKPEIFLEDLYSNEAFFTEEQKKKKINKCLGNSDAMRFILAFSESMKPYNQKKYGTDNDLRQLKKLTRMTLENIKTPSLIIHGTHDTEVKFYDGVYAFESIPYSERIWIEGGCHLSFWLHEYSDFIQNQALDFLSKHS